MFQFEDLENLLFCVLICLIFGLGRSFRSAVDRLFACTKAAADPDVSNDSVSKSDAESEPLEEVTEKKSDTDKAVSLASSPSPSMGSSHSLPAAPNLPSISELDVIRPSNTLRAASRPRSTKLVADPSIMARSTFDFGFAPAAPNKAGLIPNAGRLGDVENDKREGGRGGLIASSLLPSLVKSPMPSAARQVPIPTETNGSPSTSDVSSSSNSTNAPAPSIPVVKDGKTSSGVEPAIPVAPLDSPASSAKFNAIAALCPTCTVMLRAVPPRTRHHPIFDGLNLPVAHPYLPKPARLHRQCPSQVHKSTTAPNRSISKRKSRVTVASKKLVALSQSSTGRAAQERPLIEVVPEPMPASPTQPDFQLLSAVKVADVIADVIDTAEIINNTGDASTSVHVLDKLAAAHADPKTTLIPEVTGVDVAHVDAHLQSNLLADHDGSSIKVVPEPPAASLTQLDVQWPVEDVVDVKADVPDAVEASIPTEDTFASVTLFGGPATADADPSNILMSEATGEHAANLEGQVQSTSQAEGRPANSVAPVPIAAPPAQLTVQLPSADNVIDVNSDVTDTVDVINTTNQASAEGAVVDQSAIAKADSNSSTIPTPEATGVHDLQSIDHTEVSASTVAEKVEIPSLPEGHDVQSRAENGSEVGRDTGKPDSAVDSIPAAVDRTTHETGNELNSRVDDSPAEDAVTRAETSASTVAPVPITKEGSATSSNVDRNGIIPQPVTFPVPPVTLTNPSPALAPAPASAEAESAAATDVPRATNHGAMDWSASPATVALIPLPTRKPDFVSGVFEEDVGMDCDIQPQGPSNAIPPSAPMDIDQPTVSSSLPTALQSPAVPFISTVAAPVAAPSNDFGLHGPTLANNLALPTSSHHAPTLASALHPGSASHMSIDVPMEDAPPITTSADNVLRNPLPVPAAPLTTSLGPPPPALINGLALPPHPTYTSGTLPQPALTNGLALPRASHQAPKMASAQQPGSASNVSIDLSMAEAPPLNASVDTKGKGREAVAANAKPKSSTPRSAPPVRAAPRANSVALPAAAPTNGPAPPRPLVTNPSLPLLGLTNGLALPRATSSPHVPTIASAQQPVSASRVSIDMSMEEEAAPLNASYDKKGKGREAVVANDNSVSSTRVNALPVPATPLTTTKSFTPPRPILTDGLAVPLPAPTTGLVPTTAQPAPTPAAAPRLGSASGGITNVAIQVATPLSASTDRKRKRGETTEADAQQTDSKKKRGEKLEANAQQSTMGSALPVTSNDSTGIQATSAIVPLPPSYSPQMTASFTFSSVSQPTASFTFSSVSQPSPSFTSSSVSQQPTATVTKTPSTRARHAITETDVQKRDRMEREKKTRLAKEKSMDKDDYLGEDLKKLAAQEALKPIESQPKAPSGPGQPSKPASSAAGPSSGTAKPPSSSAKPPTSSVKPSSSVSRSSSSAVKPSSSAVKPSSSSVKPPSSTAPIARKPASSAKPFPPDIAEMIAAQHRPPATHAQIYGGTYSSNSGFSSTALPTGKSADRAERLAHSKRVADEKAAMAKYTADLMAAYKAKQS